MAELLDTTPEEREAAQRELTRQRVIKLVVVMVIAIVARLIVKDPPKYVEPDHSNQPVVYLPGMLDAMSEADREKLTPAQLAKFREADLNVGRSVSEDAWVKEEYSPTEAPPEIREDIEAYQEQVFQYAKRKKKMEEIREEMLRQAEVDRSKKMLVLFKKGGYLKVQNTWKQNGHISIMFDDSIKIDVPKKIVKRTSEDALTWKEPVPAGYTRFQPAKGITLTLKNATAKRIKKFKAKSYASL